MSIRDGARQEAERRWTRDTDVTNPLSGPERMNRRIGFELGAVWAREQATPEPSDAEVEAAKAVLDSVEYADEPQSIRAALLAAQEVRRG